LLEAWEALRSLWRRLFGGEPEAAPAAVVMAPAPPPGFAAFANPFVTGEAGAWPGNLLVRYTFAAVEAWARDQGCPRPAEETALEFANRLARQRPHVGDDVRRLAQWFSSAAYGGETLSAQAVGPALMGLWARLGGA
jgi:hypothetical protein